MEFIPKKAIQRLLILSVVSMVCVFVFEVNSRAANPQSAPSILPSGSPSPLAVHEVREIQERDFILRNNGELNVLNARGDIIVEGWAQDRIRVKGEKIAKIDDPKEAHRMMGVTDLNFKNNGKIIELSAEYGKGLDIEGRLKERALSRVSMDLTVFAPSSLPLKVWAVNGKVTLKNWSANIEIRTTEGPVEIENIKKSGEISVFCSSCSVKINSARGPVRCLSGNGNVALSDVEGSPIYTETDGGQVHATRVEGDQLYVTQTGSIVGLQLKGRIEFQTHQGSVNVTDSSGFLSGRTESGTIFAQMNEWEFLDKALIESMSGSISLVLPSGISAEVDLRSGQGKVFSAFPLLSPRNHQALRKERSSSRPFSRMMGIVRDGGEQLKLASESGDVSLLSEP
jgi:DUF4097 and DUF4098 domain-containing protein YvlB